MRNHQENQENSEYLSRKSRKSRKLADVDIPVSRRSSRTRSVGGSKLPEETPERHSARNSKDLRPVKSESDSTARAVRSRKRSRESSDTELSAKVSKKSDSRSRSRSAVSSSDECGDTQEYNASKIPRLIKSRKTSAESNKDKLSSGEQTVSDSDQGKSPHSKSVSPRRKSHNRHDTEVSPSAGINRKSLQKTSPEKKNSPKKEARRKSLTPQKTSPLKSPDRNSANEVEDEDHQKVADVDSPQPGSSSGVVAVQKMSCDSPRWTPTPGRRASRVFNQPLDDEEIVGSGLPPKHPKSVNKSSRSPVKDVKVKLVHIKNVLVHTEHIEGHDYVPVIQVITLLKRNL